MVAMSNYYTVTGGPDGHSESIDFGESFNTKYLYSIFLLKEATSL